MRTVGRSVPPAFAAYCPACDHLLADGDVVKIIGRHMDGVDPTFRCPVCDGEITHPSRAPEDAEMYETNAAGTHDPERPAHTRSPTEDAPGGRTGTVVEGRPPVDATEVRAGDRITVHYDAPGRTALQTAAGTVADPDPPDGVAFETDTKRWRRLDPATGVLADPDDRLGVATRVRITR